MVIKSALPWLGPSYASYYPYGFFQPLATGLENLSNNEARYILALKAGLLAFASDAPPIVAVEFARRAIFSDVRPSFKEMEDAFGAFLKNFETVYHFNGQQTVTIKGDKASGTSYCLVTLIGVENGYPLGTDIRRVREQLASMDRRLLQISKELEQLERAREGERV